MSLVIRYLNANNSEINEDFFKFIDCHNDNYYDVTHEPTLSGNILAKSVLKFLQNHELNFENFCRNLNWWMLHYDGRI